MSASSSARPFRLLWLDLETTGLDPRVDKILECAWCVTAFAYPWTPERFASAVVAHAPAEAYELMDEKVREMHSANGLLQELVEISERGPEVWAAHATTFAATLGGVAPSVEAIENALLSVSEGWPLAGSERVALAGSSVHFDLGFIRQQMPRFAARLSHRCFDTSVLSLACSSLGRPPVDRGPAAHRALSDLEGSMGIAREAIGWLQTSASRPGRLP